MGGNQFLQMCVFLPEHYRQWLIVGNNRHMLPVKLHHIAFRHTRQPLETLPVLHKAVVLKPESPYVCWSIIG
jgi:hypothetical protein